jgi:hypothetical protein
LRKALILKGRKPDLSRRHRSTDQAVVFGVRPDPEPDAVFIVPDAQGAMVEADMGRPKSADALETERGVVWIGLEQLEVLVGQSPDLRLQPVVMGPEGRGGMVVQRGRVRPAAWSASA